MGSLCKYKLLFCIFFISSISKYLALDDCCRGQTWTHCSCKDKSQSHSRCCPMNQICAAGDGCINKDHNFKEKQIVWMSLSLSL